MSKNIIGSKLIKLKEVDSTNEYASNMKNIEHGTVITAEKQTKGRGQRGNKWSSRSGENITASFYIEPDFLSVEEQFYLSMIIALSVRETIVHYIDECENIKVKWANDIYYKDKKIAGILIENSLKGHSISSSIVGIGINVNQTIFDEKLPNPVSIKQIKGENISVENCISILCKKIEQKYNMLKEGKKKEIKNDYMKNLYRRKGIHSYIYKGHSLKAEIFDVLESGHLILRTEDNNLHKFDFSQIKYVL